MRHIDTVTVKGSNVPVGNIKIALINFRILDIWLWFKEFREKIRFNTI